MKKLIYVILVAISSSVAISACTQEEVTPVSNTGGDNGGGGLSEGNGGKL